MIEELRLLRADAGRIGFKTAVPALGETLKAG
jgi:hypothetical protein